MTECCKTILSLLFFQASEDLSKFHSEKTNRGPLTKDWKETSNPIMCSYKVVEVRLDVWGLQSRLEDFIHKVYSRTGEH